MMTQTNYTAANTAVSDQTLVHLRNNVKTALELVMGDSSPEMLDEMSTIFLEDSAPLIDQMKDGLQKSNYSSISMAAHALKGSSATIGLLDFANICLTVESASKQEETDIIGINLIALESEFSKVAQALQAFIL